jgi:methylenetetrahydrofolate dehydrogenase (NADP+)/methenyltetrahydrofolate cyclohydrolase
VVNSSHKTLFGGIVVGEARILYGKEIAETLLAGVAAEVKELKQQNISPLLMTLEVGEDPASQVYLSSQRRVAEMAGISYETIRFRRHFAKKVNKHD